VDGEKTMKHVEALETYCGKIIPSDAGESGSS
jgi:hypothetical protein